MVQVALVQAHALTIFAVLVEQQHLVQTMLHLSSRVQIKYAVKQTQYAMLETVVQYVQTINNHLVTATMASAPTTVNA